MKMTSRRTILKTGAAAISAIAVTNVLAVPKIPGETRVLLLLGDYWHNGVAQEYHLRSIFTPAEKWRIIAVRGPEFFTPELIGDADLLITARYDGNDNMVSLTDSIT